MQGQIRSANQEDLQALQEFLMAAGLGTEGLSKETVGYFLLMEDEAGKVTGTLGIEKLAEHGLLRSLVIASGNVEQDLLLLLRQAMQFAAEKQIQQLFLATNKEAVLPFFEILGFRRVERSDLPEELFASPHIQTILTVDNSLFLKFSF